MYVCMDVCMDVWMSQNVTLHYNSKTNKDSQLIFSVNSDEGARNLIYEEISLYLHWYGGYRGKIPPTLKIVI